MPRLTDSQLATLVEEIAAAMRAGLPVSEAMSRLARRRLGGTARAANEIHGQLERGVPLPEAVGATVTPLGPQVAAAVQSCQQSGTATLLQRLALQVRRRRDLAQRARLAWWYPLVLLAVGYTATIGVMAPLVRSNHGPGIAWPAWLTALADWLEINGLWLPGALFIGVVLVLAWISSRQGFSRNVGNWLFCESLADQIQHNVPEDLAIRSAAQLSLDTELAASPQPTLQMPKIERLLSPAEDLPIAEMGSQRMMLAKLRFCATVYADRSRRQTYVWTRLMPRLCTVGVGGGLIVLYALFVIAPVYQQVARW